VQAGPDRRPRRRSGTSAPPHVTTPLCRAAGGQGHERLEAAGWLGRGMPGATRWRTQPVLPPTPCRRFKTHPPGDAVHVQATARRFLRTEGNPVRLRWGAAGPWNDRRGKSFDRRNPKKRWQGNTAAAPA